MKWNMFDETTTSKHASLHGSRSAQPSFNSASGGSLPRTTASTGSTPASFACGYLREIRSNRAQKPVGYRDQPVQTFTPKRPDHSFTDRICLRAALWRSRRSTLRASSLSSEICRFPHTRSLMGYLGCVPRETEKADLLLSTSALIQFFDPFKLV
jgi:hypothetical protein